MKYKFIKHCTRIKCNDLQIGDYIIIDERPTQIKYIETNYNNDILIILLTCVDIFTNKKYRINVLSEEVVYTPYVTKNEYIVMDVIFENDYDLIGQIKVIGLYGPKVFPIPMLCDSDQALAVYIIDALYEIKTNNKTSILYVNTICAFGEEHIKKMHIEISDNPF